MERTDIEAESIPAAPLDLRQGEARAYRAAARRRRWAATALRVAVLLAAALAGDRLADALATRWAPLTAVLLALALGAALEAVALPFGLAGWRAARRAGLSRQELGGWLADRAKAAVLGAVLGLPAVAYVVWVQRALPDLWPAAVWAASLVVTLGLAIVFPVVLLPLFLRSEELPEGPLRRMVDELVGRAGLAVRSVHLLRLGEKTAGGNAAVAGIGPTRRILLGDTLAGLDGAAAGGDVPAERLAETRAVLAHELAHHRHGDIWRGLAVEAVTSLGVVVLAAVVLAALPGRLAHGGAGDPAALPALALGIGAVSLPVGLLSAWHSRRREWAADRYAVELAGGEPFARALERLVATNLSELRPPSLERLRASHPPPGARIAAARAAGSPP